MKRIFPTGTMVVAILAAGGALAAERIVKLNVEGMTCPSCPYIVKRSLEGVQGVLADEVSFEDKSAVVRFDDATADVTALTEATARYGFPARVIE